ncbi:zinc finger CCCH domain-containing protein 11A isoform X1 [Conger conger]|uniref:zinc finger CCCH domain-containing protein 11A isoform X1 n=1 Tax=Conger conger TaxID=82655 RepID=UPI002A59BE9A|nr:zinc finger CCCH domain-containing protein 11A isoform X1 [Conger conger]XP_061075429.1 zinc finger CCCH domain-containing protein 11A isoform X1 [Conger conger]XP_061075430.1 zinc finger CCCH domain-containing protein 11A isoform X1 [Conger conger]XP_061075431.1 zinc finger CCCH domain-containing protein 11A isoform X1 [Conger conger]XP_061075432.1 zinc finger CCCH domain-containing protein 11A isoform X1 [Conger conger]
MTNHGDDCYFFYYSTCAKGDSCPFRHCEAAMGSETVCNLWQENRCFRKVCKFRHMEIKKKRNAIACYWENQPAGCQKPHCAFHHEKPRMIDGVFVPPSKAPIPRKEVEEEPVPIPDPSSPAPVPIANPANPQLRGVIKAETLENVPSPTHPPVVINPADDEDEDEDDQFSEEGDENSSRMVSPRKLLSSPNTDDSLNFGIRTLEEIRLRKALKANLKKAGQTPPSQSQGSEVTLPSGQHSNGSSGEKENFKSFIRPSHFTARDDAPLLNEEPVKRRIAERLGKRKGALPSEQIFIVKKDLPAVSELPLKRSLAERLGRKVESLDEEADPLPQKAVRDRLGLLAEPAAPDNETEVQASGEIRIKTLEEIRLEKLGKSQGQGPVQEPSTAVTKTAQKAPSPVKRSAKHPGGVHIKTFSELLRERKKKQEEEEAAAKHKEETQKEAQKKVAGVEQSANGRAAGGSEAHPQGEVLGKVQGKKTSLPRPSEVRVKTLEEIRKEKAARMLAKEQEAKVEEEETPAPPSALPKRRILRINKAPAAGADAGSNPTAPETNEKPAGAIAAENGPTNGRRDSPGAAVKVKTFQEIMEEKRLRAQQGEKAEATAGEGASSIPPEPSSPPSAPKDEPPSRPLRKRASPASNPAKTATQPKATAGRHGDALKQRGPDPATLAAGPTRAVSPSPRAAGASSPPAKRKGPSSEGTTPPSLAQEEPQVERTQGPAPKRAPVQTAEAKVRPKLNVKPSVVKATSQVKLGQKRKALESHRSAVAAVKPLNSTPTAVENHAQESPCKRADVKAPEMVAPSVSVEVDAQVCPLAPRVSSTATSSPSEADLHRTADAEYRPATPEPVFTPAKEPPAASLSSPVVKTPVQPKTRRQSMTTPRAPGPSTFDDLDELMNEFADDPLDGEMELDPAKDEDDLLLELSEMIDS